MDDDYYDDYYDDDYDYADYGESILDVVDLTWVSDLLNNGWFWVLAAGCLVFWWWQKEQQQKAVHEQAQVARQQAAAEAAHLARVVAALEEQLEEQYQDDDRQRDRASITEYLLGEVRAKRANAEARVRARPGRAGDWTDRLGRPGDVNADHDGGGCDGGGGW